MSEHCRHWRRLLSQSTHKCIECDNAHFELENMQIQGENELLKTKNDELMKELIRLKAENERLREALEYYANESHWSEHPEYENASCFDDKRPEKVAQKALNNES